MLVIFVLIMSTAIFGSFYTEPPRKFILDATPVPVIYYDLGAASPWTFSIIDASKKYDLDPEYLAAMILTESCVAYDATGQNCVHVDPWSFGLVQEEGLSQINPNQFIAPASYYWEPDFNIHEGARLLRQALDVARGDKYTGLSRYNTGIYAWWINDAYASKAMRYYTALRKQRKLVFFRI